MLVALPDEAWLPASGGSGDGSAALGGGATAGHSRLPGDGAPAADRPARR